jgi:hypothetical protein
LPKCTLCEEVLGLWDGGFICPKCFCCYRPNEVRYFEGFDFTTVIKALEVYELFRKFGFVRKGRADIEYVDGTMISNHLKHKD